MVMVYINDNRKLIGFLTHGKEYNVEIKGKYCLVWNDIDQHRRYKLSYFISKQEYRNKKIDELLNDKG